MAAGDAAGYGNLLTGPDVGRAWRHHGSRIGVGSALTDFHNIILSAANSGIAEAAALFFIPFLHEDVAIVAAALLIAAHRLALGLAVPCLSGGMISRDLLLYGLGAFARRSGKARDLLISPRVQRLADWVRGRMIRVIVVARIVPGLMFPTYIACGWFGLAPKRFAAISIAVTAAYLPIVLTFGTAFGRLALDKIGNWAWLGLCLPLISIGLSRLPGLWRRMVVRYDAPSD